MTDSSQGATLAPPSWGYLDFWMAQHQARASNPALLRLPPEEQRLLEVIAAFYASHQTLSMMQVLDLSDVLFLSSSAISRKVERLREADLVRVVTCRVDRRVRFVEPSEKACTHFAQLSALMASTLAAPEVRQA